MSLSSRAQAPLLSALALACGVDPGVILVVSSTFDVMRQTAPTLQVLRDKDERWIQPRRIWNQHTYHITNVREDGTIPQFEKPSWEHLNTYRTNAQIEGGGICKPLPAN